MRTTTNTPTSALSEIQLQAKCFQWLWNTVPQTRGLFFHVPNGGSRNAIEGMQLKASGVIAGIPDCLFVPKGKVYGFEFKTHTGNLSLAQSKIHSIWTEQSIQVFVIRSPEEFYNQISPIILEYFGINPKPNNLF